MENIVPAVSPIVTAAPAWPADFQFAPQFLNTAEVEAAARDARERVLAEIDRLCLGQHVERLERDGYTFLTPEEAGPEAFISDLRDAVIAHSRQKMGDPADFSSGKLHKELASPFGSAQIEMSILLANPLFEQALMHEKTLALTTYLLGESCILSHMTGVLKGAGPQYLPVHADQNQTATPAPFPELAQVANVTWALSDYTAADGAVCFVPGSHRFCRHPGPAEAVDLTLFQPLEVPAGSVIIWHGNTWHGALPRRTTGFRISLILYFARWYLKPIEDLSGRIAREALDRNSQRFAVLTGVADPSSGLGEPDLLSIRPRAMRLGPFA